MKRPVDQIFRGRRESIQTHQCVPAPIGCGGEAKTFRDELSAREFTISGLCQECQDKIFVEPEGDDEV